MRTFSQSLRVGLMVGIGGGIPTATNDIRLGDIVISYPTDICGGVLQHDMGRIGEDGKLTRTGSLNNPPRLLLAAANKMKTLMCKDPPSYPSYIEKVVQKMRAHDEVSAGQNCKVIGSSKLSTSIPLPQLPVTIAW